MTLKGTASIGHGTRSFQGITSLVTWDQHRAGVKEEVWSPRDDEEWRELGTVQPCDVLTPRGARLPGGVASRGS